MSVTIKKLRIGDKEPVRLMAAVNLSQESFYKGSIVSFSNESELKKKISVLIEDGTEIFDLGPKSSAPINIYGTETEISVNEEIKRISVPLKIIQDLNSEAIVSIDTQSSKVAEYAFSHGADIINDISGLHYDEDLSKVVGDHSGYIIVMASKNKPGDVYKKTDVIKALTSSIASVLNYLPKHHVIVDPGIGGWIPERTPDDDFQLILDTPDIKKSLESPALIALSRKSFLGNTFNLPPNERLYGSLSATAIAVLYGANIIRSHDIRETKQAIIIAEKFKRLVINGSKSK